MLIHSGKWIAKKKADIMLASWAYPEAVATAWLSKLYKANFFFKVHGSDINNHGKYPARAKQIIKASKTSQGIISVSTALKNKMISFGVEGNKIQVIYNGVDHSRFFFKSNTSLKQSILFVGNLKQSKGVFELLKGFHKVANKHPDLNLIFAGPDHTNKALMKLAAKLDLEEKVVFLGCVDHREIPLLMQNSIAVALPSYNEGVPNVLLEAMACGKPVLATSVGGIPEIIKSYCGVLIKPKNEIAVKKGLEKILSHEWESDKIINHSLQFSWERNKKQLLDFLS